jgi:hypothetical protein
MQTLKALAIGTVPLVGLCMCLLLLQVSAAVERASQDEVRIAAGATTALRLVNQPCAAKGGGCGTLAQATELLSEGTNVAGAANVTLGSANRVLQTVNAGAKQTLATVNQPCGGGKPCGTLADVAKTLNTVRGTFGQVEIAANRFDQHDGALYEQETALYGSARTAIDGLAPVESSLTKTTLDFDALVRDPNMTKNLANLQVITFEAGGILHDGRITADKLVAPQPWYRKLWTYTYQGASVVGCVTHTTGCTF